MHRSAAPVAAALGLAVHFRHDRIYRHTASQRVAMLAIGRDHRVGRRQRLHHAGGDRLLADVEMHEPADLLLLVKLGAFFLKTTNADHSMQQSQQVLAGQVRLYRMALVHDDGSAIDIG